MKSGGLNIRREAVVRIVPPVLKMRKLRLVREPLSFSHGISSESFQAHREKCSQLSKAEGLEGLEAVFSSPCVLMVVQEAKGLKMMMLM